MMLEFDFSAASTHLRYNLLIGLVAPRPIALVTSLDATGRINAAPFSAFNYVGTDPALVVLGIGSRPDSPDAATGLPVPKDSVQNIRRGGEFVINVVSEEIAEAMNVCAIDFPPGFGELAQAKLTTAPCKRVAAPRIAESPACLECREVATLEIGRSRVVIGEVLCAGPRRVYRSGRTVCPRRSDARDRTDERTGKLRPHTGCVFPDPAHPLQGLAVPLKRRPFS
jgi:flavin reductase (DIM6/NTAB) family NADH-FMN oxidoreductase RutF